MMFQACQESGASGKKDLDVQVTAWTTDRDQALSQKSNFRLIRDGLYVDSLGNIGFKVIDASDHHPVERYINHVYSDSFKVDGIKKMREVIDLQSFRLMKNSTNEDYYRDKNHIYYFYEMSDGGTLSILDEADIHTFSILDNSSYAIDKKSAFFRARKIEQADIETFEVAIYDDGKKAYGWYAKDKNNYYEGKNIISKEQFDQISN